MTELWSFYTTYCQIFWVVQGYSLAIEVRKFQRKSSGRAVYTIEHLYGNLNFTRVLLHSYASRPTWGAPPAGHQRMVLSDWLPTVLGTGPVSGDMGRVSRTRAAIWGNRGPFLK